MVRPTKTHAGLGAAMIAVCNAAFSTIETVRRLLGRPPVNIISTRNVQQGVSDDGRPIVLVDVRDPSERSISSIPGAISQRQYEADADRHRGKIVVPYCTVGGRSYLYARRLVARGIEAENYRDSILGWIQDGQPLETPDGRPTNHVHPYWRIFKLPAGYETRT